MSKAIFNYEGIISIILCDMKEKMKDIFKKYVNKNPMNLNEIHFLYNGDKINEELKYEEIINDVDKRRNTIDIIVVKIDENIKSGYIIKSKEIICPECKENTSIDIKNYQIHLNKCKNKHKLNNIIFNEFEQTQNIDISKIICQTCGKQDKGHAYKNEFYKCLNCNLDLCPLCKSLHDNSHKVINYDLKYYLCHKHCENYSKYCENCKKNICLNCENERKIIEQYIMVIYYQKII